MGRKEKKIRVGGGRGPSINGSGPGPTCRGEQKRKKKKNSNAKQRYGPAPEPYRGWWRQYQNGGGTGGRRRNWKSSGSRRAPAPQERKSNKQRNWGNEHGGEKKAGAPQPLSGLARMTVKPGHSKQELKKGRGKIFRDSSHAPSTNTL